MSSGWGLPGLGPPSWPAPPLGDIALGEAGPGDRALLLPPLADGSLGALLTSSSPSCAVDVEFQV